jgi:hypothetical protein
MAVFIEPPVTSSNCYETIKNASILIKLGTNVNWNIAFVKAFSCYHGNGGLLKIAKNHYFALIFFIKTDFKVLQLLNGLR